MSEKFFLFRVKVEPKFLREGERLCVCGNVKELGEWDPKHCVDMEKSSEEGQWNVRVKINTQDKSSIEYKYCLFKGDTLKFYEDLDKNHCFDCQKSGEELECVNLVRSGFREAWLQPNEAELFVTKADVCVAGDKECQKTEYETSDWTVKFEGCETSYNIVLGRKIDNAIELPFPLPERLVFSCRVFNTKKHISKARSLFFCS